MALPKVRPWKKGDKFSASHLNEPVGIVQQLAYLFGGGESEVMQTPRGTSIFNRIRDITVDIRVAKITNVGPGGAADFTNEMYWVKPQYMPGDHTLTALTELNDDPPPAESLEPYPLPAMHVGEALSHTHDLSIDQVVIVVGLHDRTGQKRWFIIGGGGGDSTCVIVAVDSPVVKGGAYNGTLQTPVTANFNPATGALAFSDFSGGVGDACFVVNLAELGATNHLITGTHYYVGKIVGLDPDTEKFIVAINDEVGMGSDPYQCYMMDATGSDRVWGYPSFPI